MDTLDCEHTSTSDISLVGPCNGHVHICRCLCVYMLIISQIGFTFWVCPFLQFMNSRGHFYYATLDVSIQGKMDCLILPFSFSRSVPAGCSVDPVNYFGSEHITPMLRTNKRGRETEDISRQQKLQISLNYNACQDEADRSASIPNPNVVSTGLRLSYDDDERNSSVTSASGSMTAAPSIILSLGDNITTELDRQKEEFDQYIKIQEEYLAKGVRDMKQRHMASFLTAIEKGVSKKLREKDIEIENINRKNRELVERIKQVAIEAQNWHYKAKYNESVVNVLKSNLQQAISQGAELGKEGFGDSEVDDAASYIDPNNYLSLPVGPAKPISRNNIGLKEHMTCRACKAKEVSILLMPCRHLCLCKDCDELISVCPVCQLMKTASVPVYLS